MKKFVFVLMLSLVGAALAGEVVKIASFRTDISPELGVNICGYSPNQSAVEKHDPLYACGLAIDDGEKKALVIALDLLGLDGFVIRDLRRKFASELGIPEAYVFFSCTHNHSGPESVRRMNLPDSINAAYMTLLENRLLASVQSLKTATWHECNVFFNATTCDENYNRRFVTSDNYASFTPHRRVLGALADGPADKELGLVFFYDINRTNATPGGDCARYVIGNFAAHVLATHAPGIGGRRLTADYPGFFRDYLKRETGADAMFVQGAAGDLVPKGDELGMAAARRTGENLAMGAITAMIDAARNAKRFRQPECRLGAKIVTVPVPMRSRFKNRIQHEYDNSDVMNLEVHLLAIGDLCFVGMPGEAASEIGSEIKWHSPFRKTWVANLSTGFAGYISPANAFVQGGYEPKKQPFSSRGGLMLVNAAVDGMFTLREELFPTPAGEDPHPDNLDRPLVCIPGGVKETNFRFNEEKQGAIKR